MERKERLRAAYDYLRSQGKVHTQIDVASAMGATRPNVSAALKGKEGVLTDSFLKRFNAAYGLIFNTDWLIEGSGEMLAQHSISQEINGDNNTQVAGNNNKINCHATLDKAIDEISAQRKLVEKSHELVEKSQEQIDRLLNIIETMKK